jgi:hypothetical protein
MSRVAADRGIRTVAQLHMAMHTYCSLYVIPPGSVFADPATMARCHDWPRACRAERGHPALSHVRVSRFQTRTHRTVLDYLLIAGRTESCQGHCGLLKSGPTACSTNSAAPLPDIPAKVADPRSDPAGRPPAGAYPGGQPGMPRPGGFPGRPQGPPGGFPGAPGAMPGAGQMGPARPGFPARPVGAPGVHSLRAR